MKEITIINEDYRQWLQTLKCRYQKNQIKAAIKVNAEMLKFYWDLGKDIVTMDADNTYGSSFYKNLSADLKKILPNAQGLSSSSIRYAKRFYLLYNQHVENLQQLAEKSFDSNFQQVVEDSDSILFHQIFSVPWGHHLILIDKCGGDTEKALFYVNQTVKEGWSRNVLLNFIDTNLYDRQGKALTNFSRTLPNATSDLAQELTKDPYNFAFTGMTNQYNERLLKDALLDNITKFLLELGSGFAYIGKEYRLEIGNTENFIDLLFYNLDLRCYVVVEVKTGKFEFADMGQLSGYVVACNHILRKEGLDNPTIGLLVCRSKDNTLAQYALEGSNLPVGISEYELSKLYPTKVEGSIPTIAEIEKNIDERFSLKL